MPWRFSIALVVALASTLHARDDDPALKSFYTANGLFNRGLYELAAVEYRQFLDSSPDHEHAPVARYGLGASLARAGDWNHARDLLRAAIDDPRMPYRGEASLLLAQAAMHAGDFAEASSILSGVIDSGDSPAAPDAAALLVESLYRAGRHDQACASGATLASRWPTAPRRPRAELFWGMSLAALDNDREACARFRAAADAYPDDAALALAASLVRLDELDQARREYQGVIARGAATHADPARLGLARIHLDANEPAMALEVVRGVDPQGANADDSRLVTARALLALDRPAEAAAAVELLASDAKHRLAVEAGYLLGKARLAMNEPASAADAIRAAIDAASDNHPRAADLQYDLGAALHAAGRSDDASAAFQEFILARPNHPMAAEAWRILAWNSHRAGDHDRSQEHARRALALNPTEAARADLELLLAECQLASGDSASAARAYARLAENEPLQAGLHLVRQGAALVKAGEIDDAVRAFESAAERGAVEAEYELGAIWFDRGDWTRAAPWLERYAAKPGAPRADAALLRLGLSRRALGSTREAIVALETVERSASQELARRARFELGQTFASIGDDARARPLLTSVADHESELAPLARLQLGALESRAGRLDAALGWFDRAALDDAHATDAAIGKARALLAVDRHAEAIAALEHADGDEPRAWRAVALSRSGRRDEAASILRALSGVSLTPATRDAADAELAWIFASTNNPGEARAVYERLAQGASTPIAKARASLALADLDLADDPASSAERLAALRSTPGLDPDVRAEATYRAAAAARALRRPADAAAMLSSFEREHPGHRLLPSALALLGESWLDAGRPADAIQVFDDFLGRYPDDAAAPIATLKSGQAAADQGAWARSERAYARYLDLWPDGEHASNARFGLGFSRENQARFTEAIADYRAVVDAHSGPTAARAQFQLGECLYALGSLDEAVRELLRVDILYAYPEWSAAALHEAGRALAEMDQPAEARRQWQAVIDRFPGTRWADLSRLALDAPATRPPGKK